jgi:enamine deaminase RidA (YjgF/YER057c/UK114 family)
MTLEFINPANLPRPETYTQVVVAKGSRLVLISGQEPEDVQGRLVGPGDLSVQARQVFTNLGRALAAADARPEQVAKITIYVVNYRRDEHLPVRFGLPGIRLNSSQGHRHHRHHSRRQRLQHLVVWQEPADS